MQRINQIISLLTDFGSKDIYVASMKGVILGICPTTTLIDISHEISRHNVLQGAFMLSQSSPYFPKGSIHLAVVDPGVGTARRRIIIQGDRCFFVGPDNGLLSLAAEEEGIIKVVEVRNDVFMLKNISRTFEGRDVFAPIAAHLARGAEIDEFGPEIYDFISLSLPEPKTVDGKLVGKILHIDNFGNIITNFSKKTFKDLAEWASITVTIGTISRRALLCKTYIQASMKTPLIIKGSSGFLEVAANRGSAKKLFKAKNGIKVIFTVKELDW